MAKSQVKGSKRPEKSLCPNAGTEARLSILLTNVAGGFAMTVVRNETQRHSAALKNAGQNPIAYSPLDRGRRLARDVVAHAVGTGNLRPRCGRSSPARRRGSFAQSAVMASLLHPRAESRGRA